MLIKKEKIPVKKIVTIGILPSFLKKIYYKLKGYKIGKNVSIGPGSVVIGDQVEIGEGSNIGFMTVVRAKNIKIGRFVKIGSMTMIDTERFEIDDDSRINEQVIIGGIKDPESGIKIGKRTIIMEYSFINPTKPIEIGDDTGIGGHCLLFTHGSWLPETEGFPVTFAPIKLGKRVWLPWRVFIMPGVSVGDNVVIGANSLVTKDLPANCLAAGSPAKIRFENYPPKLSDEKRSSIVVRIFDEFITFMKYNNFEVEKFLHENGFIIKIIKESKSYYIYYINNFPIRDLIFEKNSAIIIDNLTDNSNLVKIDANQMVIDFQKKTRIGSNHIGEEFLLYISRNGIRFDRLD